jgi:cysteine desulfurase/selenocysteine lyase
MNLDSLIKQEFSLKPGLMYLNHAAVGPWPARTAEAIRHFATENETCGAQHYLDWIKTETGLREQFTRLINAPSSDDIAILKNTSEALSFVAYGLEWKQGDNVVISNQEFPSNSIVWHSLESLGVEVREADLNSHDSPEAALLALVDKNTKLLSISSVQYASGLRMDLSWLGEALKKKNILFCIDAIQSIGAVPFDVQNCMADFVMADTHKWMLGPEGVTLFYCRDELREKLRLQEFGWHMLDNPTDYTSSSWHITPTARRFECGSPNMLGIHGASASVSLLLEIGLKEIEQRLLERTRFAIECIHRNKNLDLLTSIQPDRLAGIVTFNSSTSESQILYQKLMKNNVICAARGGGVRFSPHFYTSFDTIEKAVELAALAG